MNIFCFFWKLKDMGLWNMMFISKQLKNQLVQCDAILEDSLSLLECVWWNCRNKRKTTKCNRSLEASALMSQLLVRVGANVFQGAEDGFWNWWWRRQMCALWVVAVLIGGIGELHQFPLRRVVGWGAARVLSAHALFLLSYAVRCLVLVGVAAILLDVTLEISRFGSRVKGIRSCLGNGQEGNGNAKNELYTKR